MLTLQQFISDLRKKQPSIKVFTDEATILTKGTDAGFYRLLPKVVCIVNTEEEVIDLVRLCSEYALPLTYKAGGTSLSGQTISNSVLVELGQGFATHKITDEGKIASFGAAVIGTHANTKLAKFHRKLGPSPASIASAKIGGIVANNASGSSYGIAYNSYNTIKNMRLITADGSLLDTGNQESRSCFAHSHKEMLDSLRKLSEKVKRNNELSSFIQNKYQLKNTCGYGVNSLLDFDDPIDILQHLMVGSEGTLGFISNVTFETVPDYTLKATSLIYFPTIKEACDAIIPLRGCSVSAAELMDRNALRTVEDVEGMPSILKKLGKDAVALLIDTSANDEISLNSQIKEIQEKLAHIPTLQDIEFTSDTILYNTYWKVRKGLFTSAAATRPKGTACIIEDLAFNADVLGEALLALQDLLIRYKYTGAVIWGHLLDGNIHFVVMPDFRTSEGIEEYRRFMFDLVELTVKGFNGSLKAEHGTGRNMAPFVEFEWGTEVYSIMKEIKQIIDPLGILNPGVILNSDADIFTKNLKALPEASILIDKCIECGFCEAQCPSRNLTLTPRQRIVLYRELSRLRENKQTKNKRYKQLVKTFSYSGEETCATDGLCELACPVGINTGKLIKELRFRQHGKFSNLLAGTIASNFSTLTTILPWVLKVPHAFSYLISYKGMEVITKSLFFISGHNFPLWTRFTPSGNSWILDSQIKADSSLPEVVYFPSCINRVMGKSADYDKSDKSLVETMKELLIKAGFFIVYPEESKKLCCGMAFDSKGFKEHGLEKAKELEIALLKASDNGRIPILCDMSPCLLRMKDTLDKRLKLYEPVEFILTYLLDKLDFEPIQASIAIHSTCSNTKMGLEKKLFELASLCASEVIVPDGVSCCGWAGDRGFFFPELNKSALKELKPNLPTNVKQAYTTSRTCEIGLSMNSGISYKSIVYLVNGVTRRKENVVGSTNK